MNLVASMNCRNELSRYLERTVTHLLSYVDEVRVQDDGSDDGSFEWLAEQDRVEVQRNPGPTWREHEGELHQNLLDWTLEACPTHVLAIDADEIVPEGEKLRGLLEEQDHRTYTLRMCEVWRTGCDPWLVRTDGGWRPHEVGILYRLPPVLPRREHKSSWRIWGRKMAGGRVPRVIRTDQHQGHGHALGLDILHLGWSNPAERQQRYQRYVELDGGNFHAKAHLDSILLPDGKIGLEPYSPVAI